MQRYILKMKFLSVLVIALFVAGPVAAYSEDLDVIRAGEP